MPRILSDDAWRKLSVELTAYRASGLTPFEVMELRKEHQQLKDSLAEPAPLPMNLLQEDIPVLAGLLCDEDWSPATETQGLREEEQWNK